MIISEKQILSLMRISECYSSALHKFGEYKAVEEIQTLLAIITNRGNQKYASNSKSVFH